jgi:hypothetical protein
VTVTQRTSVRATDVWYKREKLQIHASGALTDVYHYKNIDFGLLFGGSTSIYSSWAGHRRVGGGGNVMGEWAEDMGEGAGAGGRVVRGGT